MTRRVLVSACAAAAVAFVAAAPAGGQEPAPQTTQATTTFTKDVLPILQKNCQGCHRPGEIGPMPLLTYAQARPYARAIKTATQSKKMPPWFADSSVQHYANDMSLPAADISTLAAWADGGAPEGDPKDAPPARTFVDGWNIGTPDKVVQMPEPYNVPAAGTIEYTYIILPTRFTEDTWVQALEIRPGNRSLMHHAVLYERTPDSRWLREYPAGVPFVPAPRPGKKQRSSDGDRTSEGSLADEWLVGYVPGAPPYALPPNTAFLVKANADFVLQLHYTANGTAGTDQTRIGMVLAKEPPAKRAFVGLVNDGGFVIPPGDPAYQTSASVTLASNVELLSAGPHMHLRGKAMDLRAVYPGGQSEMLFHVPRYDFNWQQLYQFHTARTAPRDEARRGRRLGQLDGQPLQSGPACRSALGRPELGRDAARDRHHVDRSEGRRHQAVRGAAEEGRRRERTLVSRQSAVPGRRPGTRARDHPLTRVLGGATVPADGAGRSSTADTLHAYFKLRTLYFELSVCGGDMRYARLGLVAIGLAAIGLVLTPRPSAQKSPAAEKSNMELVGWSDLQGRSAYQPLVHKQGDRFIAYIGHHGAAVLNPLTGKQEDNGTSLLDVTNPKQPKYLAHIPGAVGQAEAGGAQMVRVCDGSSLPRADRSKVYLLRSFGGQAHEIWDVTNPSAPSRITVVVSGLRDTHKSWWECDTGIAYLVGQAPDWRTRRMTMIYDLGDPAKPVFIRNFGLPGQQPGSTGPVPTDLHGPISTGPRGNRVYFGYGTGGNGVLQIVDRNKLLTGPKEPTDANLVYPQVARIDLPADAGAHTAFPMLGMQLPEFANQKLRPGTAAAAGIEHDHDGAAPARTQAGRDFVAVVGESLANECFENRQLVRMVDITVESKPFGVSTWTVPEASGRFCDRGGRFGTHSSNENMTPIYYNRVLFIAHFNAGVRALDVRDPFNVKEIGFYIPAVTDKTDKRCVGTGAAEKCKVAIQTNNVDVDDRGYIYIADRANTGLHILELSGAARKVANFQ